MHAVLGGSHPGKYSRDSVRYRGPGRGSSFRANLLFSLFSHFFDMAPTNPSGAEQAPVRTSGPKCGGVLCQRLGPAFHVRHTTSGGLQVVFLKP